MSGSDTMGTPDTITPRSIAADQEPKRKVRTFRVLKHESDLSAWEEFADPYTTVYTPDAAEVGAQYGEGDYLLIESDSKYDFHYVYPMRVVADRFYRLADDETA